ncbi:MAG: hypothetical protein QM750_07100 [Rubrivivax sp.]
MVDVCKASKDWAGMDEQARLDFLRDAINEMLDRHGLGGDVDVRAYDATDSEAAEWRYADNAVYVDRANTLTSPDFEDALNTAYHEGLHAAMDKENGGPTDIGDHVSQGHVFEYVHDDENLMYFPPGSDVPGEVHIQQVYRVADQMVRGEMAQCKLRDEYGAAQDLDEDDAFNFTEDDLDDDEDDGGVPDAGSGGTASDSVVIEMGEPTVRDGDNDDGLLIEMLDDQVVVAPAPPVPPSPPPGP